MVVSDGEDNQSEVTRAQAIEMAERAEVLIYAISTDDSGLILRGDRVLEDLASATGGRAFFPYKMKDITSPSRPSKTNYAASMTSPTNPPTSTPMAGSVRFKSPPSRKTCRCGPATATSRQNSSDFHASKL